MFGPDKAREREVERQLQFQRQQNTQQQPEQADHQPQADHRQTQTPAGPSQGNMSGDGNSGNEQYVTRDALVKFQLPSFDRQKILDSLKAEQEQQEQKLNQEQQRR
jgi:hypothetical protein